jgi:voltage-gated potassium channel
MLMTLGSGILRAYILSGTSRCWMDGSLKVRIFRILDPGDEDDKYFESFIMGLIILNVAAVILETVNSLYVRYAPIFSAFNVFSIAVFSVEYILRVWSCGVDERFRDPLWGRLRFMVTPLAIIDLLVVLPFYLPIVFPELRFLRAIRLFRLFRMLKLVRYSESINTLAKVLRMKKEALGAMFFFMLILLIVAASLMYKAEHDAQPKAFSSIPAAMWWGIETLATVGYGDLYPVTPLGKLIGSIVVILGIGLFALPTGILAAGFAEEIQRERGRIICPHCGRYIDEEPDAPQALRQLEGEPREIEELKPK